MLQGTLALLKPVDDITRKLSANNSIISEVIPIIKMLQCFLNKNNEVFVGVGTMKTELITQISTRFASIEKNNLYNLSTILDPRYKTNFCTINKTEAKSLLYSHTKSLFPEPSTALSSDGKTGQMSTENQSNSSDGDPELISPPPSDVTNSVWDCYNEIIENSNTKNLFPPNQDNEMQVLINKEIDNYLNEPVINKDSDPIIWWKSHKLIYSHLSALAAVYLSAPSTSVYSERAFSEAGNVYTEKRARLTPEHAETLIFLHHNLLGFQ